MIVKIKIKEFIYGNNVLIAIERFLQVNYCFRFPRWHSESRSPLQS